MLPSFAKQTVTRIRPGEKPSRGTTIPDWDHVTELTITGCSVQPAGTALSEDGRVLGVMDGLTAYLPPTADVQAGDRIRYDGKIYTINGDPRKWPSATGRLDNILLNLQRWEG